jgi:LysR family cys regulon transcriptional activator
MYDFIREFAPHLTRDVIDTVMAMPNKQEREAYFTSLELPVF